MKICITHIKNEEYMLPWWLMNHVNKFDIGFVIDYNSTDNSLNIVRELAPHWIVLQSRNNRFGALECDAEIVDLENYLYSQYDNPVILVLTIAEFLIGNTKFLDSVPGEYVKFIMTAQMCDTMENMYVEPNKNYPLTIQRTFGYREQYVPGIPFPYSDVWTQSLSELGIGPRGMRCIHNVPIKYELGRHYWQEPLEDRLLIASYRYSPHTLGTISRMCAIQDEMSEKDIATGFGTQHIDLNEDMIFRRMLYLRNISRNLSDDFNYLEALP